MLASTRLTVAQQLCTKEHPVNCSILLKDYLANVVFVYKSVSQLHQSCQIARHVTSACWIQTMAFSLPNVAKHFFFIKPSILLINKYFLLEINIHHSPLEINISHHSYIPPSLCSRFFCPFLSNLICAVTFWPRAILAGNHDRGLKSENNLGIYD